MSAITIYTSPVCPYCVRAKALFKQKGRNDFIEIDISRDETARAAMMEKSGGRRTVPQIFIDDQHIGGCDDLYALEAAGKLDAFLRN